MTLPLGQGIGGQECSGTGDREVRGSSPLPTPENVTRKWEWDGDPKKYHRALCIAEDEALPVAVIDPAGARSPIMHTYTCEINLQ